MLEFARAWFSSLPDSTRIIAAVVSGAIFIGGGLVDTRLRANANAEAVEDLEQQLHGVERTLEHLEEDVDDVLCMLILEESGENPLICVEDHRSTRR